MKKVLLLFNSLLSNKQKGFDFAGKVQQILGDGYSVETAVIGELMFEVSTDSAKISHHQQGFDINDFDLVVIRHIGKRQAESHAIAVYCRKNGVKFIDSYFDKITDDKLGAAFEQWASEEKISIPKTIYGPVAEMAERLPEFDNKAVYKDIEGIKGRLNFVVASGAEMMGISRRNPDTNFLLQEFIPNDFDYRILVFNYQPAMVIKRTSGGESHLNNTSQGGAAEIVDLSKLNPEILIMAAAASRAEKLEAAGVDVIVDKTDANKFYVLEINHAPQISSGSFRDEKAAKYAEMLKGLL